MTTTTRKSIGSRRIPLHDHQDLNSGGKLVFSGAIVGGLEVITGSVPTPPATSDPSVPTTDTVVDHETLGATETIDITQGNWHRGTLDQDCTITVSGFAEDTGAVVIVEIAQDSTGAWGITWDPDVEFSGSDQPEQTASVSTFFVLFTSAGDSTVYGAKVGSARKWEIVTDGEDVLVWEGDDLVYEWNDN